MCSLKSRLFSLKGKCISLATDCCLHLYFETAWLSTITGKSTFYIASFRVFGFAAKTLVCYFTGFQIDTIKDTSRWLQIKDCQILLYSFESNLSVPGVFRVEYVQHMAHLYSTLNFLKGFHSVHFMFSQQSWKTEQSINTLLTEVQWSRQR